MVSFPLKLSATFLIIIFSVDGKPQYGKLLPPSDANVTLGFAEPQGSHACQISSDVQPTNREPITSLRPETTKPRADFNSPSNQIRPASGAGHGGGEIKKRLLQSPHEEKPAVNLGPGLPKSSSPPKETPTPIPGPSLVNEPSSPKETPTPISGPSLVNEPSSPKKNPTPIPGSSLVGDPSSPKETPTPISDPSLVSDPSAQKELKASKFRFQQLHKEVAHEELPALGLGPGLPGSENDLATDKLTPKDRPSTASQEPIETLMVNPKDQPTKQNAPLESPSRPTAISGFVIAPEPNEGGKTNAENEDELADGATDLPIVETEAVSSAIAPAPVPSIANDVPITVPSNDASINSPKLEVSPGSRPTTGTVRGGPAIINPSLEINGATIVGLPSGLPSIVLVPQRTPPSFSFGASAVITGSDLNNHGTAIHLVPSALRILVENIETKIASPSSPPLPVITFGSNIITADSASPFVFSGQTSVPGGPPLRIAGPRITLAPSASEIVVGTQTVELSKPSPLSDSVPLITISDSLSADDSTSAGNSVSAVDSVSAGDSVSVGNSEYDFVTDGKTLSPGGPAITVSGTPISVAPGASQIVIGSSAFSLVPTHFPVPTTTLGSLITRATSDSQFTVDDRTLISGLEATTISGTRVSITSGVKKVVTSSHTEASGSLTQSGFKTTLTASSGLSTSSPVANEDPKGSTSNEMKIQRTISTWISGLITVVLGFGVVLMF